MRHLVLAPGLHGERPQRVRDVGDLDDPEEAVASHRHAALLVGELPAHVAGV